MATQKSLDDYQEHLNKKKMSWVIDLKNWTKISEQTAALILAQCETALKETIKVAKTISAKSDKVLSLLVPVISGLVIYILSYIQGAAGKSYYDFLPLSAILSLILLLLSFSFIYLSFKEYRLYILGDYPKHILRSEFIDNDFNPTEQYLNIVLYLCENIQARIDENSRMNEIRTKRYVVGIRLLLWLPVCPILAYTLRLFI